MQTDCEYGVRTPVLSIGLALLGAHCAGPLAETERTCFDVEVAPASGQLNFRTVDDELAEIADRVPGFGGYDRSVMEARNPERPPDRPLAGKLTILLVNLDESLADRAQAELDALFPGKGLSTAPRELREVPHDYRQLKTWFAQARDILSLPGVVSADIDETKGRLEYGVVDTEAVACVEKPSGAWHPRLCLRGRRDGSDRAPVG